MTIDDAGKHVMCWKFSCFSIQCSKHLQSVYVRKVEQAQVLEWKALLVSQVYYDNMFRPIRSSSGHTFPGGFSL